MSTTTNRTTFSLPNGYEDKNGDIHQEVVMRKVKNSDIIAIQKDVQMKQLAKEKVDLVTNQNPVTAMMVNGMLAQMFALLFTQVVEKVGDIETINKTVFIDMYQEDLNYIINEYGILNGIDTSEAKLRDSDSPLDL